MRSVAAEAHSDAQSSPDDFAATDVLRDASDSVVAQKLEMLSLMDAKTGSEREGNGSDGRMTAIARAIREYRRAAKSTVEES